MGSSAKFLRQQPQRPTTVKQQTVIRMGIELTSQETCFRLYSLSYLYGCVCCPTWVQETTGAPLAVRSFYLYTRRRHVVYRKGVLMDRLRGIGSVCRSGKTDALTVLPFAVSCLDSHEGRKFLARLPPGYAGLIHLAVFTVCKASRARQRL